MKEIPSLKPLINEIQYLFNNKFAFPLIYISFIIKFWFKIEFYTNLIFIFNK